MKASILFFASVFLVLSTCAQNDSVSQKDMSIDLSTYAFSYNTGFTHGSIATGLTLSLNTNGLVVLQYGVLYDFGKYSFYEKRMDSSNGIITYVPVYRRNIFIPILLHYQYYKTSKIHLFATAGVVLGGQYSSDQNHKAFEERFFNLMAGSGISIQCLKCIQLSVAPNMRYNSRHFYPGISMDASFLFRSRRGL